MEKESLFDGMPGKERFFVAPLLRMTAGRSTSTSD
jgi:hypothetical protein